MWQNLAELATQVVPWLSCYAIATVVSLAALFLKLKIFRDQLRHRRTEFRLEEEEQTDRVVRLKKHTTRSFRVSLKSVRVSLPVSVSANKFF